MFILLGVTLEHYLFVQDLLRYGYNPQSLYVILSRLKALKWLVLTFQLSLDYMKRFVPPLKVNYIVRGLLARISIPANAPATEITNFNKWHTTQMEYSYEAEALWKEMHKKKKS